MNEKQKPKKICFVTGTRAEFGLMSELMRLVDEQRRMELQIVVTGSHLVSDFGSTYKEIEDEGFKITKKVHMLLAEDNSIGVCKSMGLAMIGLAEAMDELCPDFVVLLGDRYETFVAAIAAVVSRKQIIHIHGGEVSTGAIDEQFRHAVTKLSTYHFTAAEEYKRRVIQMGEDPDTVFNFGALGVSNIGSLKLLSRDELETSLGFKFKKRNILVTYHPSTNSRYSDFSTINVILEVIRYFPDIKFIFTAGNADENGKKINQMIGNFVSQNPENSIMFDSLGKLKFLSCLAQVDGVLGNSSSGLIEAPAFKIGAVNVGDRQDGRLKSSAVIDCEPNKNQIIAGIKKLFDANFREQLQKDVPEYLGLGVAQKMLKAIDGIKLGQSKNKVFKDFPFG